MVGAIFSCMSSGFIRFAAAFASTVFVYDDGDKPFQGVPASTCDKYRLCIESLGIPEEAAS
jgi:hypothetical protein